MIKEAIENVVDGENLSESSMMGVMDEVMSGTATPAQIAAFMTALRIKGETIDEVTGAARIMRQKAVRLDARSSVVVDTCGTGGDKLNTFNISTAAAFVVAGTGITVAKHGNRAVSSGCGSADVLESLGVNINIGPEVVEECLQEIGIGFLFAPILHSAMKYAIGPRREIGIRTIFNMLGPLTNPAGATCQLIGVYSTHLTEMFAGVLRNLGTKRAFIVHGSDGMDEATVTGTTRVSELKNGSFTTYNIDPFDIFGDAYDLRELAGGTPAENGEIILDVFSGRESPRRKIVLLNAALAIMAGEKAANIAEGLAMAEESIDGGLAMKKLKALIELSNS